MECKRCTTLPQIHFTDVMVCLTVPTHHHVAPIGQFLDTLGTGYSFEEDTFLFHAASFADIVRELEQMGLSGIEKQDIRLLPYPAGEPLSFRHLKHRKSLLYWTDLALAASFLDILGNARIEVRFQPIVEARTGKIFGYEGLSRGVLPDGALMMPDELFSHARKTDTMFFLDRVCRESVIAAAAARQITEKVFINFIPTSIYDPDKCLKTTDAALRRHGLHPEQIVFEVVETEYIEDFKHLNHILDYYRAKGYATALDDMGSGYATTDSLLNLKPNYLKVDMDIVRDVDRDLHKQQILQSFLSMGRKHGIRTLAEGVETEAEFSHVRAAGVDFVQGYYFGKPEP